MKRHFPLQNPPVGLFSSNDLLWSCNHYALIGLDREADFVDGEGRRLADVETSFFVRNSRFCVDGKKPWLEYKQYWCCFGPQDIPTVAPQTPLRRGTYPKEGVGSRPRGQKEKFNEHSKRDCRCHFTLTREKAFLQIHYPPSDRKHVNNNGAQCHGKPTSSYALLGPIPPPLWGQKCVLAPHLSSEVIGYIEDMLRSGRSVQDIFDYHVRNQFLLHGPDGSVSTIAIWRRDNLLTKQDIYNIKNRVDTEVHRWNGNDQSSVGLWISANEKRVLLHHKYIKGPLENKFLLAIQDPWQLNQLVTFSNGSVLACDSTFATNKYGFPSFTLVSFDQHQMGLPVAFRIQQGETTAQIGKFLTAIKNKALSIMPTWSPSCFLIDCAEAKVFAINSVFPNVQIYFCSWHVRRAWKDQLIKKVPDRTKLLDMNDELGNLMYADSYEEMESLWSQFKVKWKAQADYIKYFEKTWMDRTDKWMQALRTMKRANQNTNGAVEAFNCTFKKFIRRKIGDIGSLRLDRLLHCLLEVVIPFFWYQSHQKELGRQINHKAEEIVVNSLHKALYEIKDHQISFPNSNMPNQAMFQSLKSYDKVHLIHNIYSKFPSYDCKWADQGNMCKHQLKALLIKGHKGGNLAQQLGTRFGTDWDGVQSLSNDPEMFNNTTPHVIEEVEIELPFPEETQECSDFNTTQLPLENSRALKATLIKLEDLVEGHQQLTKQALIVTKQAINKLKQMKVTFELTGKSALDPNDAFVKPIHITGKRRLGVVDIYHGGARSKRVGPKPKKRKGVKNKLPETGDKLREGEEDSVEAVLEVYPSMRQNKESFKVELARLGERYKEGRKRKSRKPKPPPHIPPREMHLGSLGQI